MVLLVFAKVGNFFGIVGYMGEDFGVGEMGGIVPSLLGEGDRM